MLEKIQPQINLKYSKLVSDPAELITTLHLQISNNPLISVLQSLIGSRLTTKISRLIPLTFQNPNPRVQGFAEKFANVIIVGKDDVRRRGRIAGGCGGGQGRCCYPATSSTALFFFFILSSGRVYTACCQPRGGGP